MTDKERLEEIETKYSTLTVSSEKNSTEYTEVDVEDLVFLIQTCWNATGGMTIDYESLTDRHVNITKEILEEYQEENERLEQQNKRYREAIRECIERMNAGGAGTRSFVYEKLIEVLEESE